MSLSILFAIAASAQTMQSETTRFAAGGYHSAAICPDGTLWDWGSDNVGELGVGIRWSPVQVGSENTWAAVVAGREHTVALKTDGTIWAWGDNGAGQLGDGTTTDRSAPVPVGTENTWAAVAAGSNHTLGLKTDGTLWAWGWNTHGQLGDGTTATRLSPVRIGNESSWVAIAAGNEHSVALRTDGTLWAWGENSDGQLGDGTTIDKWSPVRIGADYSWVAIAGGWFHTLALKADGSLWAWGLNSHGQLGDGTTVTRLSPVPVGTEYSWVAVAAGRLHTLALKADGSLWAWGYNWYCQLGDGYTSEGNRVSPVRVGSDGVWTAVAAGQDHTLAMQSDGTLWAWGYNRYGQVGDGTTLPDALSPQQVGPENTWVAAAAGWRRSFAVKQDRTLWAWGANSSSGQLGDGTTLTRWFPVQVGAGDNWTAAAVGDFHTLGLGTFGTALAWGWNNYGQLGDGTTISRWSPVPVGDETPGWSAVTAGKYHSLAINGNLSLWAWGWNYYGQLGDGTAMDKSWPVQVGGDSTWTAVAAGCCHTLGIKSDGSLWAWGLNSQGQLGIGWLPNQSSPVQVGVENNWATVAAGLDFSIALKLDGTLWAWGDGGEGQLGNGPYQTSQYLPLQVGTQTDWVRVAAGDWHVLAIKKDGTLWAWGRNDNAQLGIGGAGSGQYLPLQVGTQTDWAAVTGGDLHSLAVKTDGTLWAWGDNYWGQVADGYLHDGRPVPTKVLLMPKGDPTMQVPETITVAATSPEGAVVTFEVLAHDCLGTSLLVTCQPPSGSLFPVGITTVLCSATDPWGRTVTGTFDVVVYQANCSISGNGWINSPEGAISADPTAIGKASVSLRAEITAGANVPTGSTVFQFKTAGLYFASNSYLWLLVTGAQAQLRGLGTINGTGTYAFLVTALDNVPDRFRIIIWDSTSNVLVYDNQPGTADEDPLERDGTLLVKGNIIVRN